MQAQERNYHYGKLLRTEYLSNTGGQVTQTYTSF